LKECTKLKRVNITFQKDDSEDNVVFEKEIKFYTGIKAKD